jgi:hypothetical protein
MKVRMARDVRTSVRRLTAALPIALTVPCLAHAELIGSQLGKIEAAPEPNAPLPADLKLENEAGDIHPLQQWLGGKPTIWVLADYTCPKPVRTDRQRRLRRLAANRSQARN